jgi:hypothetical protein
MHTGWARERAIRGQYGTEMCLEVLSRLRHHSDGNIAFLPLAQCVFAAPRASVQQLLALEVFRRRRK